MEIGSNRLIAAGLFLASLAALAAIMYMTGSIGDSLAVGEWNRFVNGGLYLVFKKNHGADGAYTRRHDHEATLDAEYHRWQRADCLRGVVDRQPILLQCLQSRSRIRAA